MTDFIWTMWRVSWLLCGCIFCGLRYATGQQELGDTDLGCPQGSYHHDDFCYIVWPGRLNYPDAEITCKANGGLLAPIKDLKTQKFLHKLYMRKLYHNFWFGLTDKKIEGKWVFSDNTSISTFNKWDYGQPDNVGIGQHCTQMWMWRNLHWDDLWCNEKIRYICEYNADKCRSQFPRYGQSCYELSQDRVTYDEADKNCQSRGGILATIKNEDTYNFLKKIIYAERFWLNMTEEQLLSIPHLNWSPSTWIGIKSLQNNWVYSDGSPVTFTNWAPGNPDNLKGRACVRLTRNLWENEKCDLPLPFICQYPGNIHCPSSPTNSDCSSGCGSFTVKSSFSVEVFHDNKKIHESQSSA